MPLVLRIVLIVVSLLYYILVAVKIRKSNAKIEDSIFWLFFAFVLVVISCFPQIAIFFSSLIGIQSAVNFVFLVIIFMLIMKIFSLSIRVSHLEESLKNVVQKYAIDHSEIKNEN